APRLSHWPALTSTRSSTPLRAYRSKAIATRRICRAAWDVERVGHRGAENADTQAWDTRGVRARVAFLELRNTARRVTAGRGSLAALCLCKGRSKGASDDPGTGKLRGWWNGHHDTRH